MGLIPFINIDKCGKIPVKNLGKIPVKNMGKIPLKLWMRCKYDLNI